MKEYNHYQRELTAMPPPIATVSLPFVSSQSFKPINFKMAIIVVALPSAPTTSNLSPGGNKKKQNHGSQNH